MKFFYLLIPFLVLLIAITTAADGRIDGGMQLRKSRFLLADANAAEEKRDAVSEFRDHEYHGEFWHHHDHDHDHGRGDGDFGRGRGGRHHWGGGHEGGGHRGGHGGGDAAAEEGRKTMEGEYGHERGGYHHHGGHP